MPIETAVQMRDVEVPASEARPGNLQEDLAGKNVTIHFKGDKVPPASGTVMKLKREKGESASSGRGQAQTRYLVLKTAKGQVYVEPAEIAYVETENAEEKIKRRQPRLLLTVGETDKAENKVAISYLTHGLSWAPSYRIDITDPKTLALEQQAVVKNELTDLDGAEIKLISGFPSVQFAHVTSPLSTRMTWDAFFQQLNQRGWRGSDLDNNRVVGQQTVGNAVSPYDLSMAATPAGEGVDLHYQSIGKRSLAEGDSLALSVARSKAAYERIVEWLVPDTRDEFGRNLREGSYNPWGRYDRNEDDDGSAWDALKFKNPFSFAMTTGPAMVVADGKFDGQRTSYWVNAGEETMLRINKALSVRTRAIEHEEQQNGATPGSLASSVRDVVWIGGYSYRKCTVEGELTVSNHRKETIQFVIRRRFSGDLVKADGDPKISLREEGVYSVNRRNELLWTLPLKAGEEKKLTYRYTVLVRI